VGLFDLIFGKDGGATVAGLRAMTERDRFAEFLPWEAYGPESRLYINIDNTVGMMWECSPLVFAGESTMRTLEGLFRLNLPDGAIMQFILFADPNVTPIIRDFNSMKSRKSELIQDVAENVSDFYLSGVEGLPNLSGIPIRNFRLFFTVKFPDRELPNVNIDEINGTVQEILQGAGLSPRSVEPGVLLDWLRRMMNDTPSENNGHYDDRKEIRKQVLLATPIENGFSRLKFGSKCFRCVTPRSYPREGNPIQTNKLFGGIMGQPTDSDQIRTPFFFTLNIILKNQKQKLHTKCNLVLQQKGVGSFAPSLARKQEEYMWAADELERGTKFFKIIPVLWVYGSDEWLVNESVTRAKRVWEGQGYVMQEDKGILPILFISALPFGLYDIKSNVETLDRDQIMPVGSIAATLPVQGDFSGLGRPAMLFAGRKGQLFGLDIFHKKGVNNHNAMVCAESGAGKSFFLNYLLFNYYALKAKVRVIDIGGSYKKMTMLCGARYLDFSEDSDVCLNPFTNIVDVEHDIPIIAPIVAQMIFSSGNSSPSETEMTLIKEAVRWAWQQEGNDAGIDTVHEYLSNFDRYSNVGGEVKDAAARLAFNLGDFRSDGPFGRFFNGRSTFDIANDEFVVLELEQLVQKKSLFRVVTLQVINAVTQDLYLSDRSDRRLIVFDEAWQFLGESSTLKEVIEEGYRRARKYGGSFTIITQSVLDMKRFGGVGNVIRENSAFKFYLESKAFEEARNEKMLDYDDFTMDILKSTKSAKPRYSEIFMDTPYGVGVGRLAVDPFSYYVFTSDADEITEIEQLVDGGMGYEDAIREMVRKYRGD
jgi:conjugal transfer ATP-binding protein TraC